MSFAAGMYDLALEDATKAYRISTDIIREIKIARAEIITFPKPRKEDETDAYDYEWKRNDTYYFFASQIISDPDEDTKKSLRLGTEKKNEAVDAGTAGNLKKAIDAFNASTEFFMDAIKESVK